jgi:hypothetical protein
MARPSSALLRAALLVCVCAVSVAAYSRFQSAYKYLDRVDIMVNSIGTLAGPSADTALPIARIRLLGTLVLSDESLLDICPPLSHRYKPLNWQSIVIFPLSFESFVTLGPSNVMFALSFD